MPLMRPLDPPNGFGIGLSVPPSKGESARPTDPKSWPSAFQPEPERVLRVVVRRDITNLRGGSL